MVATDGAGEVAVGNATASGEYHRTVEVSKDVLERARAMYLSYLRYNKDSTVYVIVPRSNIPEILILSATIVNDTMLVINGTPYMYVILILR